MTTSTPGCDLLQLIGLDMQYARWKPSNHSKQHSENNNNYHQQNNPRRNGYHRNAGSPQKHQEHSSHLANTAGKLSQSNPNLKWNNNNNNNCSQNNAAKNQTTQERRRDRKKFLHKSRNLDKLKNAVVQEIATPVQAKKSLWKDEKMTPARDSSPWPLMGDDSGPEQSVSSTSSLSSAGGSRTAPTANPGGSGDNHGRYDQGRGSRGPAGHHDPRRDGRQHIDYNQRKQAYQHYTNQPTYKNSNGYNAYQNVAANRNQQHQNHHHQKGFHQGGGNNRRGHQNRYYNTFLPNGANFNGNGTVMTANNSNNGAQKRFQNGGRYHEMQMTVRGRRAPFVSEPSLFPLTNDPRFIELIKAGTPPDKFLTKTNLVQITKAPQQLTNGSAWDELSKAVWNKFLTNQQTKETYEKKLTLWKCLYVYLKIVYPRYSLFMVGSTMSGFGSNTSDVDMCLMVRQSELDQRGEALYHLTHIMQHFISYVSDFFINIELIHAKVPILKFKYINDSLDIDLSCNNTVGIRNTHLLYCYAKYDWRVRPLVLVVKLWAQWHDINSAKATTISSYSLALMVLHFLQCGCHPAVLPSLQQLHAARFSAQRDVDDIDFHCDLPTQSITSDVNSQPIGQLLVDFFNYYDRFDYRQYAISVRQGCCLLIDECRKVRSSKNEPHQWKYLCIEEPFDLTNTARSVNNPESFQKIRNVIHQTAVVLNATGSLDSIFRLDLANGWTSHHLAQ